VLSPFLCSFQGDDNSCVFLFIVLLGFVDRREWCQDVRLSMRHRFVPSTERNSKSNVVARAKQTNIQK
jgi:hypothetical protein